MIAPPRRVLLIRRKALGDALVTLPAVRQLAGAWPRSRLDLVVDRPYAPLLQGLGAPVRIVPWPPPAGVSWWRSLLLGGYDLVLDWLGSPRTALWTAATGARWRVGYDLPQRRWAYNVKVPRNRADGFALRSFAGEAFLDPLRELGLLPAPWRAQGDEGATRPGSQDFGGPDLAPAYVAWRRDHLGAGRRPVVLVMSATWPAKAWPVVRIAELAGLLEAAGHDPLMVCGPGDEEMEAQVRAAAPGLPFAPPTGLEELADLLTRARAFVGTDNGSRHLAACLGVPTVTIYGPTDPGGWNPPGPRHVSVRNAVPCAPCDLTECPVEGHPCLSQLPARRVAAAVDDLLARTGSDEVDAHGE